MTLSGRDARVAVALASLIVFANAAFVASKLGFVHRVRQVLETDHRHYINMATNPEEPEDPPYCFRVAVPMLARGLMAAGTPVNAAFYAITQVSLVAFLACTFLFLRARGFREDVSGVVVVLMGLTQGAVRWFEYQYWMSDPLCLALVAGAILLIELDRSWRWSIVLAILAGSVRESFVLVLPFAFFRTMARHSMKEAVARTLAIALPFFAVSLTLHAVITPKAPDDWWSGIVDSMGFRYRRIFSQQWYVLTVGTWGVFVPLMLADMAGFARRVRENLDLVALTILTYGTLVISNNTERPLAYAWPAVAAAGATGFAGIAERFAVPFRSPFPRLVIMCLGAQMLHFGLTRWHDYSGSSLYQPANYAITGVMAALWVLWSRLFAKG